MVRGLVNTVKNMFMGNSGTKKNNLRTKKKKPRTKKNKHKSRKPKRSKKRQSMKGGFVRGGSVQQFIQQFIQ